MRYLFGVVIVAVIAFFALWFTHRPDGPASYIEVEFIAPVGSRPLAAVTLIAGGDKTWLTDIEPGATQTVRIYPGDFSDNAVAAWVRRFPEGETPQRGWSGQQYYPPSTAFRTHIQIDQEGKVISEKSCQLPCSFD